MTYGITLKKKSLNILSDEGIEVLCVGDRVSRGPDWAWEDEVNTN